MSESEWIERAQSAEAKVKTYADNFDRVKEKLRNTLDTLGAKQSSDGTIDIDFDVLADKLSLEHALELRAAIDRRHKISGAAGEKPRIKVAAA